MRIIPTTTSNTPENYPTLPSESLRYYADILEEATKSKTDDSPSQDKIEEIEHGSKGGYTEYKD